MSTTKTTDLLHPYALAKEFHISNLTAATWLDDAGLVPVHTMPFARGTMRLYEPGPAREAIRARMPKKLVEPQVQVQAPVPNVLLDTLEENVEKLTAEIATLQAQNRVLLATMEKVSGRVDALVRGLGGV
jgi:hypothetical protein